VNFNFRLNTTGNNTTVDSLQVFIWYLTYVTGILSNKSCNIVLFILLITQRYRKVLFCMLSGLGETHSQLFILLFLLFGMVLSLVVIKFTQRMQDYVLCCNCKEEGPSILFSVKSTEIQ